MIGYLRGQILENEDGKILLGVGEPTSGMVGYSVTVPHNAEYLHFLPSETLELFIYSHVREDAFDLYGFKVKSEKLLFLTLLTVSGIGPKSALNILSHGTPRGLIDAILQKDLAYLTGIPGLGKKTAERMVVELRDSVQKKIDAGLFGSTPSAHKNLADGGATKGTPPVESSPFAAIFNDAKGALMGLGYRESEALGLLNQALAQFDPAPEKAEDLIRGALRQIGQ